MGLGVPIGIAAAHRPRLYAAMRPVLDLMQTLPAFVYLIPALMLFDSEGNLIAWNPGYLPADGFIPWFASVNQYYQRIALHLEILKKVSLMVRNKLFCQFMRRAKKKGEIHDVLKEFEEGA